MGPFDPSEGSVARNAYTAGEAFLSIKIVLVYHLTERAIVLAPTVKTKTRDRKCHCLGHVAITSQAQSRRLSSPIWTLSALETLSLPQT